MRQSEALSGLDQNLGKAAPEAEPDDQTVHRAGRIPRYCDLRNGGHGNALPDDPGSQILWKLACGLRAG